MDTGLVRNPTARGAAHGAIQAFCGSRSSAPLLRTTQNGRDNRPPKLRAKIGLTLAQPIRLHAKFVRRGLVVHTLMVAPIVGSEIPPDHRNLFFICSSPVNRSPRLRRHW